jgi:putative flippase GtrA
VILLVSTKEVSARIWVKQLLRFSGVGIFSTLVHVVAALIFIKIFYLSATYSNIYAFFVATIVSYVFNTLWSFEQKLARHSFFRFLIVGLLSLGVITYVGNLVEEFHYPPETSILIIVCIIPVINFAIHKLWTFKA